MFFLTQIAYSTPAIRDCFSTCSMNSSRHLNITHSIWTFERFLMNACTALVFATFFIGDTLSIIILYLSALPIQNAPQAIVSSVRFCLRTLSVDSVFIQNHSRNKGQDESKRKKQISLLLIFSFIYLFDIFDMIWIGAIVRTFLAVRSFSLSPISLCRSIV